MSVTRTLGRYRVGERVGSGGVADVYRAEVEGAAGFAKTLVVKCLRPHVADEPELVEGLAREAKLAQRLQHGNIVQVFDFGVQDGQPYVVMEHVDGCSLYELQRDLSKRSQRMGLEEALFVVEELAAALRYAHGLTDDDGTPLHVVHRDVKPRNVLVSREGVVKLADFGIAKVADDHDDTLPGVIKGTPAYLSPEQAGGQGVDARTDVFALGLVLREMVLDGHTEPAPPPDPRVDDELEAICDRASAIEPAERFEDMQALLRALQRWRSRHQVDAVPGELAAWVRRARGQAPAPIPVSLDTALLGGRASEATVPSATAVPVDPRPRLHRGWLALAVAFALAAAAWATLAEDPPAPTAEASADSSVTDRPESPATASPSESPPSPAQPQPEPETEAAPEPETTSPPEPEATSPEPIEPEASPPPEVEPRPRPAPRKEAELGRLKVNVLPWAEVTVDGRAHGRTPVDVELTAGRHRVRLHNPQLGDEIKTIGIQAGQTTTLNKW